MSTVASRSRRVAVRLPRERRVSDILAAAREVFCEHGYAEAAVTEIAARAQVVEGTIYKYFESKHALLVSVLQGWYEDLIADYARELPGIRGLAARLRYVIWRHLRAIQDDPQLGRLMFREVRALDDYPGSVLHTLNRRYTALLTGVLSEGLATGELRPDLPVRMVRDLVYGAIEHLSWRYLSGHGALDIDREADLLLSVLWPGIAVATPAPPPSPASSGLQRQLRRLERVADRLEAALPDARS